MFFVLQAEEYKKNYTVDFALGKTYYRAEGCYSGFMDEAIDRIAQVFGLEIQNAVNFSHRQAKNMCITKNQVVRLNTVPDEVCLFYFATGNLIKIFCRLM